MNALYLLAATAVAFVFGYRFYTKLLTLDVFRLRTNYSTRAQARPDGQDYVPTHPHLLLGHHVAAVTGAGAFAAPVIAAAWGWIPGFLWITIGSTVAAGTYALGSFWLASRHPEDLGRVAHRLIGGRARVVLRLLAVAALLILIAASAGLTASLLAAYPAAVLPVAAMALIAWAFGAYLHGRAASELLPATVAVVLLVLFVIWLLEPAPIALTGTLTITLAHSVRIAIDAVFVWVVLVLVYAFHAARTPVWRLMRPRGFLAALALGVMLVLFYVALIVRHPVLEAPEFHAPPSMPHALPWLFLVIGAGALAGWQLLIVSGVTGRELRRETDARYVGYGSALIQGLVALSALLLAATAFPDGAAWLKHYAATPAIGDFPRAATFYINAYGRAVTVLGLNAALARDFGATVLAALSLAVLEAAVRALKNVITDMSPPRPAAPGQHNGERRRLWLVVFAGGLLALCDGHGLGGLAAWPVFALVSLWLAAAGFALMALALRAAESPMPIPLALASVVTAAAIWSTAVALYGWWRAGAWTAFGAGMLTFILAGVLLYDVLRALRHASPPPEIPDAAGR